MPNFIKLNHHIRRKKFCTHHMQIFSKCSDLSANFFKSFDKFCNWFINYCDSSCEHVIELSILWQPWGHDWGEHTVSSLIFPHCTPLVSLFPSFTPLLIPHFPSLTLISTLFSACFKLEAFKNLHLIFQKRRSDIQGIQTWKLQNGN